MKKLNLLIGGKWIAAEGARCFDKLDPFTGKKLCEVPAASPNDARAAVDAAAAAFPVWAAAKPAQRRAVLAKAADLLAARATTLSGMVATEIGSPKPWGDFNCMLAAGMFEKLRRWRTRRSEKRSPPMFRAASRWRFVSLSA